VKYAICVPNWKKIFTYKKQQDKASAVFIFTKCQKYGVLIIIICSYFVWNYLPSIPDLLYKMP